MLARQVARASSGDGCKSKSSLRISGTPAFISARHEVCRALKACPAGEVDCEVAESSLQHSAAGDVSACNSAQVTWRASTLSLAQTSGSGLALGSLGTSGERHSHRASLTDCEKSSLLTARLTGRTNPGRPVAPLPNREAVLDRLKFLVSSRNESVTAQAASPILVWGYDPGMQGGHLDRDLLDAISTETPIWVMCYAPHIIYTNTPMLELAGVNEDSRIHGLGRYPDGRLNGWFIKIHQIAAIQDRSFVMDF